VSIGALSVDNVLLDLGASLTLFPLKMLKKIGDLKIKPTKMTLPLVDRETKCLYGLVEDVLVKVDEFIFPVDFVIMDMKEDEEVLLILGRPFYASRSVEAYVFWPGDKFYYSGGRSSKRSRIIYNYR